MPKIKEHIINNNVMKNDEIIMYIDNIDIIDIDNKGMFTPNSLLITSYNYHTIKNYKIAKGTSYELYYVNNDSTPVQISYQFMQGNGLYADELNNLYLGIDNRTIKENDNHELYVDTNELTYAYNGINKGILAGENKLFYDHHINNSGFISSTDGILKLTNGLMMSLFEIQDYYDKFELLSLEINKLSVKLNYDVDLFEVGDILYIDKNNKYTKKAEGNTPYMICVIGSNTLQDKCARFIPLDKNNYENIFSKSLNNIYYRKLYNSIPIYNNDLNMLTNNSKITSGSYGFISTDNAYWINNFKNPFNFNEHYYANLYTLKNEVIWYLDPDSFHQEDMYSINKKAIVTEIINLEKFEFNDDICPLIEIKFSDGFIGYYLINFDYSKNNSRFELVDSSKTTKDVILLIKSLDNKGEHSKKNNKVKIYNSDNLINSEDLVTEYKIYLTNNNNEPEKFENDNIDNIDYKILVSQLKDNKETIVNENTTTVTKSRVVQDAITTTEVTYQTVVQQSDDVYYYSEYIQDEFGETWVYRKKEPTITLIPVYNTHTNYVNRTEYYDEQVTNYTYTYNTIYTYKLIIDKNICDRNIAYLKVQLGDSSTNLSKIMYLTYDNNIGLEYVFTEYSSTISTGYIKITAYASSEYYDMSPIELGIIPINEYDSSFKCVHLTKEKNSFKFNLKSIIPISATVYKNYSIIELMKDCVMLESNYYNDFNDAYEYVLDLNYTTTIDKEKQYYCIIPGAIILNIDDNKVFDDKIYYITLEIRNMIGNSIKGTFKFIKQGNKIVSDENIYVYHINGINMISIEKIQNKQMNSIDINLQKIGKIINNVSDWDDLIEII